MLTRRIVGLATMLACLSITAATPPIAAATAPPSLTVKAPTTTVATYDTAYDLTATPRTIAGTVASASPITWTVTPDSVAVVLATDRVGQHAALAALRPGQATLVASWRTVGPARNVGGIVVISPLELRDSARITVTGPRLHVEPFNVVRQGVAMFDATLDEPYCLFHLVTDRRGAVYAGIAEGWSTNDTTNARRWNSSDCPQVSVDPAALPSPLPVPRR